MPLVKLTQKEIVSLIIELKTLWDKDPDKLIVENFNPAIYIAFESFP